MGRKRRAKTTTPTTDNAIQPVRTQKQVDLSRYVLINEAVAALWSISDAAHSSIHFQQALSDLKAVLFAIEALAGANGGDKTAKSMGEYNDKLVAVINQFERALTDVRKSGVGNIRADVVQEFLGYCGNLRMAANQYASAAPTARSAIHIQIAQYVALVNPLIDKVYRPPQHYDPDLKIIAEMLETRVGRGMKHADAIQDLLNSDPDLVQRFFVLTPGEPIDDVTLEHARQLVRRFRLGIL